MPRFPHPHLLLVLCLALPLAACSGGDSSASPTADDTVVTTSSSTPTTKPGSTTEPDLTPEEEVEAAYLEIVRRYYERLQEPDPDDPSIADLHTGPSYEQVIRRNREMRDLGQHDEFPSGRPPSPNVETVEMADRTTAHVEACLVDDVVVADHTGVINDAVNSYRVRSEMRLEGGRWKMSTDDTLDRFDGPGGCDR